MSTIDQPSSRRLVTAEPVAELLGLKVPRVYDLAARKLIPSVRLGRQVRFDLAKIEAFIEAGGASLPSAWRAEPKAGA